MYTLYSFYCSFMLDTTDFIDIIKYIKDVNPKCHEQEKKRGSYLKIVKKA